MTEGFNVIQIITFNVLEAGDIITSYYFNKGARVDIFEELVIYIF